MSDSLYAQIAMVIAQGLVACAVSVAAFVVLSPAIDILVVPIQPGAGCHVRIVPQGGHAMGNGAPVGPVSG